MGFLTHAGKNMPELPSHAEVMILVETSQKLSPESAPAAWLTMISDEWKKTPGICPENYSPDKLLGAFQLQCKASFNPSERSTQKNFQQAANSKYAPPVGAFITEDKVAAEKAVHHYTLNFSPSTGTVIALGGAQDGQYLALAYHNEDIATSHIFQALKFLGYQLDEQAEAQLENFEEYAKEELPQSLDIAALKLCRYIPHIGMSIPLKDLHGLHSQPHRYDQEALGNDIGIS